MATLLTTYPRRLWRFAVGTLGLRRRDVILTSFPKSGNTWVRFFLANLLSLREWGGQTVDFDLLDTRMVEYGKSNLLTAPTPLTLPRFVKTHLPYVPVFGRRRAVLIVRDPRDAIASLYRWFEAGRTTPGFRGTFADLVRHPRFGVPGWVRHTSSWMPRATVVLQYEQMRADAAGAFAAMLDALGINASLDEIGEATRRASLKHVRAVEQARGVSHPERFHEGFRFARDGRVGQGEALFTEADLAYLDSLLDQHGLDLYRPDR